MKIQGNIMISAASFKFYEMALLICLMALSSVGCHIKSSSNGIEGMPITTVGHYGTGIEISEIYVNDMYVGDESGWGGGGGTMCCIPVSSNRRGPVEIHVKWETCETINDKKINANMGCKLTWHAKLIPIHFSEKVPGHHFGLVLHFLPGHLVEAWTSDKGMLDQNYPGPKFPTDPAPKYIATDN